MSTTSPAYAPDRAAPPAGASWPVWGTTVVMRVGDADALAYARAAVERELDAIDLACSRFRADSELRRLNDSGGVSLRVSPLLWSALSAALDAARLTGGLVDPTVGRAMRLAGYDHTFARVQLRDGALVPARFVPAGRWRRSGTGSSRRSRCRPAGTTGR